MRRMSFAMTMPAILDRTKTVTRRVGWRFLKVGDRLAAVAKTMGFRKGEKAPAPVATIEVVDVRREPLHAILTRGVLNGYAEVRKEGLMMTPEEFFERFRTGSGLACGDDVTRIEFRYVDEEE